MMYSIPVKIEGIEKRKRSIGLLHVVTGFFLIACASRYFRFLQYENFLPVLPIYLIAAISIVYGFLQRRKDPLAKYNHWVRLLQFLCFVGLGISVLPFSRNYSVFILFLWAGIVLALLFSERRIFQETNLQMNKKGILIPGYFTNRFVPWMVIESVVIRPDYITFFRSNQTYLQMETATAMREEEIVRIQSFCKDRIEQYIQVVDN